MKSLRTERSVACYNIKGKNIAGEFNIDSIPVETLLTIVSPKNDDPLLYDGYVLSEAQLEKINSHLTQKITPDYKNYYYVLECFGIYDWTG